MCELSNQKQDNKNNNLGNCSSRQFLYRLFSFYITPVLYNCNEDRTAVPSRNCGYINLPYSAEVL